MSKDMKRAGSSKTASPTNQGGSRGKHKIVTFKENEIEEEKEDELPRYPGSGGNPPPGPKRKAKKGGIDLSSLDEGMDKFMRKVSDANPSSSEPRNPNGYRVQPWQVDPSTLSIGKSVGKGTFGTVYKGQYKGEDVAIKMVEWGSDDVADTAAIHFQYLFFKEVEVMYALGTHPNVCRLLGATMGSSDFNIPSPIHGRSMIPINKMMCCIVMELMPGGSVRDFWVSHRKAGNRRMPYSVVVQFALDAAKGLAYLHSKKLLHRDLKPDNMLLDDQNVLKIADFGIARFVPDPNRPDDTLSRYRGTPNYSAPEVLAGNEYTHKADVYSFGISLWEIYTCSVPYPDMRGMRSSLKHVKPNTSIIHDNLRPSIPPCCPAELKRIMTTCWDTNPDYRPEMREIVQWLQRIDTFKCRLLTNDACAEKGACLELACKPRC